METNYKSIETQQNVLQRIDYVKSNEIENANKVVVYQIFAAVVALLHHVALGVSYVYSAILIPQLLAAQNSTEGANSTETTIIKVTETEITWIASVFLAGVLLTALLGGYLIDIFGRLKTLKLSLIPCAAGWILIATARNVPTLLIGRILTGVSGTLGSIPAVVYTAEISSPHVRGALVSLAPCLISLGGLLGYFEGWLFNWRTVAWITLVLGVVTIGLVHVYLPESPMWLVSKNRFEEAKQSLKWFDSKTTTTTSEMDEAQLLLLKEENLKKGGTSTIKMLKMFRRAAVYKPFFILTFLCFFQQFSGFYHIMFYTVLFFEEIGTGISANLAAVLFGTVRFMMSVVNIALMKRYNRRTLIMFSALSMSLTIGASGFVTYLIKSGVTNQNWIPVFLISLFIGFAMIGLVPLPFVMIGELYPTEVRGVTNSISYGVLHIVMFGSIQLYFTMTSLFGGVVGLQYFFAAASFSGLIYSYLCLPETHNKTLAEIQDYVKHHTMKFSLKKRGDLNI